MSARTEQDFKQVAIDFCRQYLGIEAKPDRIRDSLGMLKVVYNGVSNIEHGRARFTGNCNIHPKANTYHTWFDMLKTEWVLDSEGRLRRVSLGYDEATLDMWVTFIDRPSYWPEE